MTGQNEMIPCLRKENGVMLTAFKDVQEHAVDFYTKLYQSEVQRSSGLSRTFYSGLPEAFQQGRGSPDINEHEEWKFSWN